jgi:hypothetical protein
MECITEIGSGISLTLEQEDLLLQIGSRKVSISEVPDRVDVIKELIALGLIRFRIATFSWGSEFELERAIK